MRVLHLVGLAEDKGGVLSVIRNLQEAGPADLQHVVWVHDTYRERRSPSLDYRRSRFSWGEGPIDARMAGSVVPGFLAVRRLLREEQFDVVHAHTRGTLGVALLVARQLDRPVVFTNHNYASRTRLYRWASRRRGVHTVVLTTDMARYYGIDTTLPQVRVIPAFCADRFFELPLVERPDAPYSPDRPLRLVGVGMVVGWKGWRTAYEAIARLRPAERACVSFEHWGEAADPAFLDELRRLADDHGLEGTVAFRGPTTDVAPVLAGADWLLHPAVQDPFPVSVIEALAMGVPALVTASGGPVAMVTPGRTGALFRPDDADDLAAAIRSVLAGDIQPLTPAAVRDSVRPISARSVAGAYVRLYDDLASASDGRDAPSRPLAPGAVPTTGSEREIR